MSSSSNMNTSFSLSTDFLKEKEKDLGTETFSIKSVSKTIFSHHYYFLVLTPWRSFLRHYAAS
jgi:hypothetical protein